MKTCGCGQPFVIVGLARYGHKPLFAQCTGCENREHVLPRFEYLWHVADAFVLRGKARV